MRRLAGSASAGPGGGYGDSWGPAATSIRPATVTPVAGAASDAGDRGQQVPPAFTGKFKLVVAVRRASGSVYGPMAGPGHDSA